MRHIFKSYLKLFVSSWLETFGTLLFLITFIIVILSMLPGPLQISLTAKKIDRQTNQWNNYVQIDPEGVQNSKVREGDPNSFSAEFLEVMTKNFMKGNVVARLEDTLDQLKLKEKYEKNIKDKKDVNDVYEFVSNNGSKKYISFVRAPGIDQSNNNNLFDKWFDTAMAGTLAVFEASDMIKPNWQDKFEKNKDKYYVDIFTTVSGNYSSHNDKEMLHFWNRSWEVLGVFNEIIFDILGGDFQFDESWNYNWNDKGEPEPNETDKGKAHRLFDWAFYDVAPKDIYKQEFSNYYYLDYQSEENKKENIFMRKNIWNPIQKNIYDQLGIKYTMENTLYTIADIGTNKNQAVNFTEIFDKDREGTRLNNLVTESNEYINDGNELQKLNIFGNDKFINSLNDNGNTFLINGKSVSIDKTLVGYKYSALTSRNDSYNYSMLYSKPEYTGELYVGEKAFQSIYEMLSKEYNQDKTYNSKRFIKISTTFYLNDDLSYLQGNETETIQNLYTYDTNFVNAKSKLPQLKMLTMVNVMTIVYSVIGLILLLLSSIFMLFTQKEELNKTRKQLGVFKSNGYKTWELCLPSSLKVFIMMFVGILIGYLCSFPLQTMAVDGQFGDIGIFSIDRIYANPVFLLIVLFVIPMIYTLIIFAILLKFLGESSINLMNISSVSSFIKYPWWYWIMLPISWPFILCHKLIAYFLFKTRYGFTFKMQAAFLSISKGKFAIIMFLFACSTFLVAMEMKAMPVMKNMFNEATGNLKDEADHESWLNGDSIELNEDGYYEAVDQWIIGRNYIDLKGDTVSQFLDKQKSMDYDDEERKLSDFVFDVNYLVENMFNDRNNFLEYIEKNIQDIDQKENLVKLSSLFAFITLISPVDKYDEVKVLTNSFISKAINEISNPIALAQLVSDYLTEFGKLPGESLMNSKLNEDFENKQIKKTKSVYSDDIIKIVWMLISGYIGDLEIAKIKEKLEIKKQITNLSNNMISESGLNRSNREGKENDIIGWLKDNLVQIIAYFSDENNSEEINDVIKNSNFINGLLPTLVLTDNDVNPLISSNAIVFDSEREILIRKEWVGIEGHKETAALVAYDSTGRFGDVRNQYKLDDVDNLNELANDGDNDDKTVNVVISKIIAKINNWEVGSNITIYDRRKGIKANPFTGKVIGIQEAGTAAHTVFVDYNELIKVRTSKDSEIRKNEYTVKTENKNYLYEDFYTFNSIMSNKKRLSFPPDVFELKLANMIEKFSYKQDAYSYMVFAQNTHNVSWFASMMIGSSYLEKLTEDENNLVTTSPFIDGSLISTSYFDNLPSLSEISRTYNFVRAVISSMISLITTMMIINITISLVLLLILFLVLVKTIINDARPIITLMRSIGYKDVQINWIVMGKYLTSSIWAFIIMYGLSALTWVIVSNFTWDNYSVLLLVPVYWYLPFVIFIIMESIIAAGFLFGVYRLKKLPLVIL